MKVKWRGAVVRLIDGNIVVTPCGWFLRVKSSEVQPVTGRARQSKHWPARRTEQGPPLE